MPPIVVCDACVLYQTRLCGLFICLHQREVITLRWTRQIQDEWTRSLIQQHPDKKQHFIKRAKQMEGAVLDWEVTGYQHLIESISLADSEDRHVVAAAIHIGAHYLVKMDKDFSNLCEDYSFCVLDPDTFLCSLIPDNIHSISSALKEEQERRRNPPISLEEYLVGLSQNGLHAFSSRVKASLTCP